MAVKKMQVVADVKMNLLKETKGALRFQEVDDAGQIIDDFRVSKIGSIYLRKELFEDGKYPKSIRVSASA